MASQGSPTTESLGFTTAPLAPPTRVNSRRLGGFTGRPAETIPGYSTAPALACNLALYPVILGHGFRRFFAVLTPYA
jgi:hypothetical protein